MKNIFNNKTLWACCLLYIVALSACTKMDDFKKYVEGGEISYTGKVDSLKVRSGKNRVLVQGLFISDPKVRSCKILWNSRRDSIIVPVSRANDVDTLKQYITNLEEGSYNFDVITYDQKGNPSIPITVSGVKVYGDRYAASIINMPISDVTLENAVATVNWGGVDKTSGALYMDLSYTKENNVSTKLKISTSTVQTLLSSYKYRSTFSYRTVYLPDSLAIDTFYTELRTGVSARTDVTASFIDNPGKMDPKSTTGQKFQPVSLTQGAVVSGNAATWRKLAGWTSNDQANNWGTGFGTYGTWVERTAETVTNFGTMSLEAGKNTTTPALNTMTNGKIYQTKLLPAGEYSIEARVGNASPTSSMYFVANVGTEIPNIADLISRPSMVNFTGAATDATYLPITTSAQGYTISINFTIQQETRISFGFVATLLGNATTNQYLKISGVRMKSLAF